MLVINGQGTYQLYAILKVHSAQDVLRCQQFYIVIIKIVHVLIK